jgi:hypothetical protein
MNKWLSELLARFSLKSPKFFQVLQTIGVVCAFLGGVPKILEDNNIHLGEPFATYVNKGIALAVTVAGIVTWILGKLPVSQDVMTQAKAADKLPYTTKK